MPEKEGMFPAEILKLFEREIDCKLEELNVRKSAQESKTEIALKSIDANVVDRRETRECIGIESTKKWAFSAFFLLVVTGLIVALVVTKEREIAIEIIKVLAYGGFGFLGGYGYRASKKE